MKLTKTQLRQMIQEAASEYVWGVKSPGRVANKYKISVLKKLIKEELEVTLTNEEAGEMFGEDIQSQLNELGGLPTGDVESSIDPEDEASPEPEFGKGKLATTQARQAGIKQAKGAGASGINDKERAILKTVLDKLQATASAGDITTGRPLALMKQLLAALDKLG